MALDAFAPVFVAVLLTSVLVGAGLLLFVVPGVYLAVRLVFVPQAVVIDGARGPAALRASWGLTDGSWWRTFLALTLANLAALLPGLFVIAPFEALAAAADRQAIALAGMILSGALTAPFVALVSTLLFYDLRSRRRATM
jgi:membrane-anchored glycerophosphoryl diester phosphodiesterase (GDPDase)